MTGDKPTVAVVRGEALNPFEMQSYRPLAADFDMLLVGRTRPNYEVGELGLPVRLLHATNEGRVTAALARRAARLTAYADEGRLFGLERAVAGRQILHAADTAIPFSAQCAEIAARTGAKLVLTCWENIPFRFDDDARTRDRKRAVQRACDMFIAVTPSARDALVAEGVTADRIRVVPAGVDTQRFRPHRPLVNFTGQLGLPASAFVVLFVGRLIKEKGVVELVRAVSRIPEADGRPLHLVLAGNGPEVHRVHAASAALGCADRVHVAPSVSYTDIPDLYASADLSVTPSLPTPYWQEQFGMVLVEAMASEVPVITTRSGSIPEVVGDAAVLVEPYDVGALTDAIRRLANDAHERATLARAARQRVESRYAVDVVAARLADVYREVLAR